MGVGAEFYLAQVGNAQPLKVLLQVALVHVLWNQVDNIPSVIRLDVLLILYYRNFLIL